MLKTPEYRNILASVFLENHLYPSGCAPPFMITLEKLKEQLEDMAPASGRYSLFQEEKASPWRTDWTNATGHLSTLG